MKPYCKLPFIQFANNVEGKYQACCIATVSEYHVSNVKPMDFFNSEYMKGLRKDMLSGKMTDRISGTCKKCISNEKISGTSKRIDNNEKATVSDDSIAKSFIGEDIKPTSIEYLKIKIYGNKCNLRCYMCSPISSSKVAADWKKHGEWNKPAIINPFKDMDPEFLYDGLAEVMPYLEMIEMVGGEPLMFPELIDFMSWLIDKGYSENLTLRFITNGTIIDPEIFSYFKDFKKIEIIVSIDAYGKKDDYIRDLSNWETKIKFIELCRSMDIHLAYSNTFTWLNIGHLPELWHFFNDTYGVNLRLNNPVSFPAYYNAVHLPKDIKDYYLENTFNTEFTNKKALKKILETEGDHDLFMQGMARTKQLDIRRGNNLLEQFPEFEKYYNMV